VAMLRPASYDGTCRMGADLNLAHDPGGKTVTTMDEYFEYPSKLRV